jgi:hypothetical protein
MQSPKTFVRYLLLACLILSCVAASACKKKEEAPASAPAAPAAESPEPVQGGAPAQQAKRKIILSYELTLEVESLSSSVEAITRLAESCGGYVFESSRSSLDKKSFSGEIGIRVPSAKSSGVLSGLRKLGRVEQENSTAEDISEQYVDLEARLKNAQASEARLKQMYQRAGDIEDVLEVEKELTRVRGDIESFMAKKRNWDILTEMVTIKISLREPSASLPSSHRFWRPVVSAFGEALEGISASLHALIIIVGFLLPWLVVLSPLLYFVVRRKRRMRNEKSEESEQSAGE